MRCCLQMGAHVTSRNLSVLAESSATTIFAIAAGLLVEHTFVEAALTNMSLPLRKRTCKIVSD
ncbi:MAG: hypothetical protein K0Q64_2249 [Nitrobacter vulgaris]|nr:hypothetical protein [Nitrobacter vulgaris]